MLSLAALTPEVQKAVVSAHVPHGPGTAGGSAVGAVFFGAVGIWCAVGSRVRLTVTSTGFTVQDDEEKGSYRWADLDRITVIGERRGARLVIWKNDADPGSSGTTVLAVRALDRKYGPARIRATLRRFAGDRYVDQPE